MKQLVFRIFDPKIPVIQVILGEILDGEFKPVTENVSEAFSVLFGDVVDAVHYDDYFGGTPFIKACDFSKVFAYAMPLADKVDLYPGGFLVLTLKPYSYVTSSEKE